MNIAQLFPVLQRTVHGHRIVYLDTAASAQKPTIVTEAEKEFYDMHYANVHRGIHQLAEEATEMYEDARGKLARFINADADEVIFTSGTTAGINIVARSLVREFSPGDEIIVSVMEHHSNFVPWQQLAQEYKLKFSVCPITPDGQLDMTKLRQMITKRTRVIAVAHVSNVLGTVNPVKEIAKLAHEQQALLVIDGAQAVPHMRVDVKEIGADFYAFSGHKMYGPSGIGILYGKRMHLMAMQPTTYGGEMVKDVNIENTTWNEIPWKFEAGTPHIGGAVGLGVAADFIEKLGYEQIHNHEQELITYALRRLQEIPRVVVLGPSRNRGGALSFLIEGVHPHDAAAVLNEHGVAVRAGHHCAQPLHCALGVDASIRASVGIYNTVEDIDKLIAAIAKAKQVFA